MTLHLKGNFHSKEVWLNGKKLNIRKSQKHRLHSSEFNWGYGGSGPAQLALAICLELYGSPEGYQEFKWKYISPLPQTDIDLDLNIDNKIKEEA